MPLFLKYKYYNCTALLFLQLLQTQVSSSLRTPPTDTESYDEGYGDGLDEYWLGNTAITSMLNETSQQLKVSMTLNNGSTIYLDYEPLMLTSVSSEVLKSLTVFFRGLYSFSSSPK